MRSTLPTRILDFLVFSNIFIACCAMAQGALTYLLIQQPPNYRIISFLGCATLFLYNFSMILARPKTVATPSHRRVRWIYTHYNLILISTVASAIAMIALAIQLSTSTLILLLVTGLFAVSYSLPLFKGTSGRFGSRNIPGAKLFIIASVWALSCVCVPIVELKSQGIVVPSFDLALLTFKRFLFVTAITIPFDIRDIFQDRQYNLKTIPVIWGERKATLFCQLLLFLYILLLLVFVDQVTVATLGLIMATVVSGWLIFKSRWQKNEYYYFLFLDGTLIFQFLCVFTFQYLSR